MGKKKAIIVLANGFEELEAIAPIDILKRAEVDLKVVGLSSTEITSARGVKVSADMKLGDLKEDFDALIFPGGGDGAKNLAGSEKVTAIIKKSYKDGRIVAAICASPAWVLAPAGVLDGKKATCYPDIKDDLPPTVTFVDEPVVVDGNIVTSQGPGTAALFGLKLAEMLAGKAAADTTRKKMLL